MVLEKKEQKIEGKVRFSFSDGDSENHNSITNVHLFVENKEKALPNLNGK